MKTKFKRTALIAVTMLFIYYISYMSPILRENRKVLNKILIMVWVDSDECRKMMN